MSQLAGWGLLAAAIAFEVAGTAMLKTAATTERSLWFIGALAAYGVCFAIFMLTLKALPLSVAYAVWGGAGAALIVLIDVFFFGQSLSALQVGFICLIIIGVVGVKLAS